MMNRRGVLLYLCITILFIAGCANNDNNYKSDYEQNKKMIVDILKSDDGQKAIHDVLSKDDFKKDLVLELPIITDTIESTLLSDEGKKFWKDAFKDPKFAEGFAKSINEEHEKTIKKLMNDPEFRNKFVELLTDPEINKHYIDLLKSNKYREHLESVIEETFENPLFKVKIEDILIKGIDDLAPKEGKDKKKEKSEVGEDGKDEEKSNKQE